MGRTTFSGPVASQNGFVTPTYTSTTLPYFIPGNFVVVSDLNTIAFGGADQWYDQRTGQGLGTGGGVTPPGPTPISFPATFTFSNNADFYDQAIAFNDTGTAIYRAGNTNLYSIPLTTPWDVSTANLAAQSTYPLTGFAPWLTSLSSTVAWNSSGTELNALMFDMNGSTPVRFTVATPYNLNTIVFASLAPSPLSSFYMGSGVTFGNSGNVAYVLSAGSVYAYQLTSPYNWISAIESVPKSYNLATNLGLYNYPQQIAFSPDGLIGIVFESGAAYNGVITQFQLSTPWDVSTINGATKVSESLSVGIDYVGFGGCAVKPDFSKLYVTGGMAAQKIYEFNIS